MVLKDPSPKQMPGQGDVRLLDSREKIRKHLVISAVDASKTDLDALGREISLFEKELGELGQPKGHTQFIIDRLKTGTMQMVVARYTGEDDPAINLRKNQILGYNLFQKSDVESGLLSDAYGMSEKVKFTELLRRGMPREYLDHLMNPSTSEKSKAGFLVYVVSSQAGRGINLSNLLIAESVKHMRENMGLDMAFAFGRISHNVDVSEDLEMACTQLNAFLDEERPDGFHPDHAVRFHQRSGAKVVCGIPYSTKIEHGFLAVYKLK
ncbi:MAG: hypothetical protein KKD39_03060 [Candidatus Altiarchaeota archaeon]|nr:hypothetical protein [Candidatus Altiarchaeota archaeon]